MPKIKIMNSKKAKDSEWIIILVGIITVLIIIGLWFSTYFFLRDLDYEDRGTLGDMFGTINSLFSGLAFAGIIFTILLQRKELGYQREELKETREEFIIQNKTLKLQRFENTFFNLLQLHHQIVSDIDYNKRIPTGMNFENMENITVKGRDVFKDEFQRISLKLGDTKYLDELNKIYMNHYEKVRTDFGHYFRNLYRIIKMVHETEFVTLEELDIKKKDPESLAPYFEHNHRERYKYTSIVRSQLSDYELLILFYNCLSENGEEKFKPLIEEYSLFKNLPREEIINKKFLNEYYDNAYKNLRS